MYDRFVLTFQEELAAIFRVNEFGSGGCWSDWEGCKFQLHRKASKVFGESELQKSIDRIDLYLICRQ